MKRRICFLSLVLALLLFAGCRPADPEDVLTVNKSFKQTEQTKPSDAAEETMGDVTQTETVESEETAPGTESGAKTESPALEKDPAPAEQQTDTAPPEPYSLEKAKERWEEIKKEYSYDPNFWYHYCLASDDKMFFEGGVEDIDPEKYQMIGLSITMTAKASTPNSDRIPSFDFVRITSYNCWRDIVQYDQEGRKMLHQHFTVWFQEKTPQELLDLIHKFEEREDIMMVDFVGRVFLE